MTAEDLFAGGGELGELMRRHDWAASPLGPVDRWPRALKTAVRIMLTSRQPMFVWWGDQLINLYNDAYKTIVGGKHPRALGQPASVVWREIWDDVGPRAASAMERNEGTYDEALLLIMERHGYAEETYYTFSYSPVPNDEGGVGGILCANSDDTVRIVSERQLALLRELAARAAQGRTVQDACALSARALESDSRDLPFGLIYLLDTERRCMTLAGAAGLPAGHPGAPLRVGLEQTTPWPLEEVLAVGRPLLMTDLSAIGGLPRGAWDRPPTQAVALPLAPPGEGVEAGVFVAGLNPYRLYDDRYQGFLSLVVSQIAGAVVNAQAYEDERRRVEALAELDRVKTTFFSNVSHEFRTPLTLMLGPLEEVLAQWDAAAAPTERALVQTAHRNGVRLLKLVNTLLDFARIEAGRVQARYEPTDLAAVTAELAATFRSAIDRAGLRLVVEAPPLPEPVYVDRDMWEKVVLNLLSNAFKFTMAGEIRVTVASDRRARGRGHGDRHRHRHPRGRAAAALRALPPGGRRARAHPRGHRHRAGAGAGAGAAARRDGSRGKRAEARQHLHRPPPARHRAPRSRADRRHAPARGRDRPGGRLRRGGAALAPRRAGAGILHAGRGRRERPRPRRRSRAWWWPTTTPTCATTSAGCCTTATTCARWPTARRRSGSPTRAGPTWC